MLLQSSSLLNATEKYHLLPFVFLFLIVGVASTLSMAIKTCLRCLGEIVEAVYDFKVQCIEIKKRYRKAAAP